MLHLRAPAPTAPQLKAAHSSAQQRTAVERAPPSPRGHGALHCPAAHRLRRTATRPSAAEANHQLPRGVGGGRRTAAARSVTCTAKVSTGLRRQSSLNANCSSNCGPLSPAVRNHLQTEPAERRNGKTSRDKDMQGQRMPQPVGRRISQASFGGPGLHSVLDLPKVLGLPSPLLSSRYVDMPDDNFLSHADTRGRQRRKRSSGLGGVEPWCPSRAVCIYMDGPPLATRSHTQLLVHSQRTPAQLLRTDGRPGGSPLRSQRRPTPLAAAARPRSPRPSRRHLAGSRRGCLSAMSDIDERRWPGGLCSDSAMRTPEDQRFSAGRKGTESAIHPLTHIPFWRFAEERYGRWESSRLVQPQEECRVQMYRRRDL